MSIFRDKSRNKLNDIQDSVEWLKNLHTVFEYSPNNLKKFYGEYNIHGVGKPIDLLKDIITFFTKEDQWVLDPFAGVGSTLLASSLCKRNAVGIDLYSECFEAYKGLCEKHNIQQKRFIVEDSRFVSNCDFEKEQFDFLLCDPPYGINHKKTEDEDAPFNMFEKDIWDIANSDSLGRFYSNLAYILGDCRKYLKHKKYLVMFLGDRYIDGHYIPVGYNAIPHIEKMGYLLKGVRIWHQKNVLRKVYNFWSCYTPVVNHWNIFIYQKI